MDGRPFFVMTDPGCFDVSYRINPWMDPQGWTPAHAEAACAGSAALRTALVAAGAHVETIGAVRGLPDLVFPANAAVVLDGRVLMARFRHPERQGEEPVFRAVFQRLKARGLVHDLVDLPEGMFHEGAGDAIWDADRRLFPFCGVGIFDRVDACLDFAGQPGLLTRFAAGGVLGCFSTFDQTFRQGPGVTIAWLNQHDVGCSLKGAIDDATC